MSIKFTAWGYNNMDNDIAIKVQGVSKTFKDQAGATTIKNSFIELGRKIAGKPEQHKKKGFTALKDINFEVKRGEFFGIVGRNGCGKSTLLKIMAGVYTPTKGAVVVNGKLTPFIELGVGFNPELSGRDNVFLNGALLGFNRKQMEAMYKDIVDFAELHEFMDMKLKNYSSGMQVRLAFSVAIRAESDILLIDEVLAVGDAAFQQKCFDYFERLKADNKTVVFVTHDMSSIKKYCDKALLVDNHKIKLIGSPSKISNQYLLDNYIAQPNAKKDDSSYNKTGKSSNDNHLNLKVNYTDTDKKKLINYNCGDKIKINMTYTIRDDYQYIVLNIFKQSGEHLTGFRVPTDNGQSIVEINALFSKGKYYTRFQAVNSEAEAVGEEILGPEFNIITDRAPNVPGWSGLVPIQYRIIK